MGCKNCGRSTSTPTGAVNAARIQTATTTEVRSWTSLPLLDVTKVPDDLDLIGGSNKEYQSWRIPASYFLPGGTLNHVTYKVPATDGVVLPQHQVVPVYIPSADEPWTMAIADGTNQEATDIAVALDEDKTSFTIMKNGYYTFSRPHMYEVGKTYYLSQTNAGEVVSVRPTAGTIQPLFSVVDQKTISINVALV